MNREPFATLDGIPRWRKMYDLVLSKNIDDMILYGEALDALGLPRGREFRHVALAAMRDAMVHLENEGRNTVQNVVNTGWKVQTTEAEVSQGHKRVVKTRKAAGRGLRIALSTGTRRDQLSQSSRQMLDWNNRASRLAGEVTRTRGRKTTEELRRMLEEGE